MRRGGSFGFVVLIVVVAIALWLTARAWRGIAPQATAAGFASAAPGAASPGDQSRRDARRDLPDLDEARRETDQHSDAIQQALEAAD